MKILYFTATGNSLAVAKAIGGELFSIPQLVREARYDVQDDEAIGLVFPVYAFQIPKIVREFLRQATLQAPYLFAVGTYGNYAGQAMANFQRYATQCGFHFQYANALLMVDNYLNLFDIDKQIQKLPSKHIEENLRKIKQDVENRVEYTPDNSLVTQVLNLLVKPEVAKIDGGEADRQFRVNQDCIRCGVCAKVCPCGNITVTDHVAFSHHCLSCYACLHACPRNALHLKHERSSRRWRNPDVTLAELIKANNRPS
jgi:ferredoxin